MFKRIQKKKANEKVIVTQFKVENGMTYEIDFLKLILQEAKAHLSDIDLLYELNKKRINTIYQILIPSIAGLIYLLIDEKSTMIMLFIDITLLISLGLLIWVTVINNFREASIQGFKPNKIPWVEYEKLTKIEQEKKLLLDTIELYQIKLNRNFNEHENLTPKIGLITTTFLSIYVVQILCFIILRWLI